MVVIFIEIDDTLNNLTYLQAELFRLHYSARRARYEQFSRVAV
jgi:hypothetical protein